MDDEHEADSTFEEGKSDLSLKDEGEEKEIHEGRDISNDEFAKLIESHLN